jgi:signal transduction histidine kinase
MPRPSLVGWLKAHPFQADACFAGLVWVVCLVGWIAASSASHPSDTGQFHPIDAAGAALLVAQVAPLAWRRRAPQTALILASLATLVLYATDLLPVTGGVPVLIATYSAAAHLERRRSVRALAISSATLVLCAAFSAVRHPLSPAGLLTSAVFIGAAWILGDNLRTRRAYTASLEERAARLELEQQESARRAVNQERARIARELHDVVAHSVSVMVVQAGAARRVVHRDADRATEALGSIESTGRQALAELRRLLGMLREYGDRVPALTPQPTVDDLETLVASLQGAGFKIHLDIEGERRTLPSAADLSVFRIVQEALTNTVKHAGPATAKVLICYRPDEVVVTVTDDGRGLAGQLSRSNGDGHAPAGHGLVGMRERVALFGGELRAGPRPGGGFEVRARLPVAPAPV